MATEYRKVTGPIFIAQLTELLAPLTTRQIVYLVRKREKELEEKIFLGGGKGCPLYLTLPLLSRYFPEFVDNRHEVVTLLRDHLQDIDHTQTEMKKAIVYNRTTLSELLSGNDGRTDYNRADGVRGSRNPRWITSQSSPQGCRRK